MNRAELEAIWRDAEFVESRVKRGKGYLKSLLAEVNKLPRSKKERFLRVMEDIVVEVMYRDRVADAVFVEKDGRVTVAVLRGGVEVGEEINVKDLDDFSALMLAKVIAEVLLFRI